MNKRANKIIILKMDALPSLTDSPREIFKFLGTPKSTGNLKISLR